MKARIHILHNHTGYFAKLDAILPDKLIEKIKKDFEKDNIALGEKNAKLKEWRGYLMNILDDELEVEVTDVWE